VDFHHSSLKLFIFKYLVYSKKIIAQKNKKSNLLNSSNTDLSVLEELQKGFSIYFLCYEKIVLVNPTNFRLKK